MENAMKFPSAVSIQRCVRRLRRKKKTTTACEAKKKTQNKVDNFMRMFVRAPFFVCQYSERVTCDPAGTMAKGPTRETSSPIKGLK